MDNYRAIEMLEYAQTAYDVCSYGAVKIAIDKALEALQKQVPKKPTKLVSQLLIGAGWIYKCATCGCACGENKYHSEVTCDDIYCTQCGQMLDWNI